MMRTVALEMLSGLRHLVDLYHHVERVVVDHVPFLSQRSGDGKKQQTISRECIGPVCRAVSL